MELPRSARTRWSQSQVLGMKACTYPDFFFWLHWVFVAVSGFSLVMSSGGICVAVHGLLTLVASPVCSLGL